MNPNRFSHFFRTLSVLAMALAPFASHAQEDGGEAQKPEPPGTIEFVGKNVVATANGTFHDWRFTKVDLNPETVEGEVALEIDIASIDTGIEKRDDHLRTSDFFHVEAHPKANIRISGFERIRTNDEGNPVYRGVMDMEIHGIKRQLDLDFEVVSRDPLKVEGRTVLNRMDFNIGEAYQWFNPMSIKEEIPVTFSATVPANKRDS